MSLQVDGTPFGAVPTWTSLADHAPAGVFDVSCAPALSGNRQGIERLLAGARCVTTGQQPGLLGGPLYTLYKAATAIAIARRLDAVPVFWVAGDDHDFAEANHTWLLTSANAVERLTLRERPDDAPSLPMYRERVGPEIAAVFEALLAHTPATEFRDEVVRAAQDAYRPDRTLAAAFAALLAAWLGSHGLVVLDPTHRVVKHRMAPILLRALEQARELDATLAARAEALRSAGASVPVHVGDRATLVMVEGDLGRDRLVADGDGFLLRRSGERVCIEDVRALAATAPERLSPNVLLRPVVEAAVLPTVAYVGGPGELAYFPQCDPVYTALAVTPQHPVPRWSARLVEPKVAKVLEKYGIAAADLALPEGQLEARLVRDAIPADATEALAALRHAVATEYGRLRDAAVAVDPTLRKPVESHRAQALAGLTDIEKKVVHHLKQQNDILVQQIAKARVNLMPLGKPQERVFGPVPFLIRYGSAFLDRLIAETDAWVAAWTG